MAVLAEVAFSVAALRRCAGMLFGHVQVPPQRSLRIGCDSCQCLSSGAFSTTGGGGDKAQKNASAFAMSSAAVSIPGRRCC